MKLNLLLSAGIGMCAFTCLYSGEKITANQNLYPYFSSPKPLMGRCLWNNASAKKRHAHELREIAKEPMTQVSFGWLENAPLLYNYFENPPPDNIRLMIREIELYSGRKNIAGNAKVTAFAPGAEIRYPERVKDGNDSRRSVSYSAPALMKKDQEGFFTFTFDKPVTISSAVIKSGQERSEENGSFVHLAANFSIQKKDSSGKWQDIPGADIKNNYKENIKVTFRKSVTVKELRVHIKGQMTIMKRSPRTFTKYSAPKNLPFQVNNMISRPPFSCFEKSIYTEEDKKHYEEWKKKNPNFLGYYMGEWDSDFSVFIWHRKNVAKRLASSSPEVKRRMQEIANLTDTREGIMKAMKLYFDAIAACCFHDAAKLNFIDCCQSWSHYAQEWGTKYNIMETTCNGYQRHQAQMYFARGSARQYGNPWGWYIAPTLLSKPPKGFSIGYTDPNFINKSGLGAAGGKGGFSPSMNMRDRYLAWFAGASSVYNEGWPQAYCMPGKTKKDPWVLSPHGEVMKEWFSFLTKNPDRGVSYAPVAIGMQWDHGVSAIHGTKPFFYLPIMRGDMMNEAVLRTIVPYKGGLMDQDWGMSETPYGDICDVILPSPPSGPVSMDILKNYRAMFLSGTFAPDQALAARLKEYVKNGGTLAVNIEQLGKFLDSSFTGVKTTGITGDVKSPVLDANGKKAFDLARPYSFRKITLAGAKVLLKDSAGNIMMTLNKYGKGNVIFSTPDHLVHKQKAPMNSYFYSVWGRDLRFPFMDWLFKKFSQELYPVNVQGHIQYGVNINKEGLLVYLFNNEGVKKTAFTYQTLDPQKAAKVKISLKDIKAESVKELRFGKILKVNKKENAVSLVVPPGDICVVKIKCGSLK